ncbi:hypothetical protein [Rhodococcus sp. 14-2496-1d]|uniref:hypothetical protein n=1 Tax=Rhodococcus sp. 14-2496-1d TaxID=2023146 RepID=UPI001179B677|nr:hypothetical protein [Rhodococcus sp. 14-2496-1d]
MSRQDEPVPAFPSVTALDGLLSGDPVDALVKATDLVADTAKIAARLRDAEVANYADPAAQLAAADAPPDLVDVTRSMWDFRRMVLDPEFPMEVTGRGAASAIDAARDVIQSIQTWSHLDSGSGA